MKLHIPIVLLPLLLLGCGSGSSTPAPSKPPGASLAPGPSAPSSPSSPSSPSAPSVPEETSVAPLPPSGAGPGGPGEGGRRQHPDAGIPVKAYLEMLGSPNSADVFDALRGLKQSPQKAQKCLPKLNELTQSKDKQIADMAADVIKGASGK